ncbi:MAG: hypothetical protein WBG70_19455 [Spirulinaceae cyanobacterium]
MNLNIPQNLRLTGILVYDWILQRGNFEVSMFVEHCYGLLLFDA